MGGPGSGGFRVGAGGRSKTDAEHALSGWAGKRKRRPRGTRAAPARAAVVMPDGLSEGQQQQWAVLAPHAIAAGTLTAGSVQAFVDLLDVIELKVALRQRLADADFLVEGGAAGPKAHPLLAQYRAMLQRVEVGLVKFQLAPAAKPMPGALAVAEAEDPFAEFN